MSVLGLEDVPSIPTYRVKVLGVDLSSNMIDAAVKCQKGMDLKIQDNVMKNRRHYRNRFSQIAPCHDCYNVG